MDRFIKKLRQFFEAYSMERLKEFIIKGRPLTKEEAQEAWDRTLELCSSENYQPDPDLESYLKGEQWGKVDGNDLKAFVEVLKKRGLEREKLRNKFLKERELAERKDSNPDDTGMMEG